MKEIIRRAIDTGEIVSIKYLGGSQPGSVREISPISIDGDDVRARCLATNRVKGFKLSKMEAVTSNVESGYVAGQELSEFTTLMEGFEQYRSQLEGFGWDLAVEEQFGGVFRKFKNGKRRKTPDVYIEFHEKTYDYTEFDEDGQEVEVWKTSTKPWYVRSNVQDASSNFKSLRKALEKFIAFASTARVELDL